MIKNLSEPIRLQIGFFIDDEKNQQIQLINDGLFSTHRLSEFSFRVRDFCFALMILVLFSPIILGISLAIYMTSGSPVFFKQARPGKDGKLFMMYKFRTMRKNAEEILKNNPDLYSKYIENNCKIKAEEDPRIIPMGCFLRSSSLDEFPQFINVLRGEMSIFGPRPVLPEQIQQYGEYSEEFLSVKPGITGLWQVLGRSEIGYPERKYIDILYIRNKSLLLDFKILLKTIKVVYTKKGAY